MAEVFNVLMVGVGGQGVILASDILVEAAIRAGHDAKKSEIHGMSQRGGPVFSHVRFGDRVYSPTIPAGEVDVLYALERIELLRWAAWGRADATAVYSSHDLLPSGVAGYPEDTDAEISRLFPRSIRFDDAMLRDKISPKLKNTALIGALSTVIPLAPEYIVAALEPHVPKGTAEANTEAFHLGRGWAAEQLAALSAG